jgi:hypothetical protein
MKAAAGVAILSVAGGIIWYNQENNHHNRAIDPEWYVSTSPADARITKV